MNAEQRRPISVTQRYTVPQSDEPGVVIGARDFERLIERLQGCDRGDWGELWLAGVGAGVAVAAAAGVGALTLPTTLTGLIDVLWAVAAAGILVAVLCLIGYLTRRRDHASQIGELKKDLEMRKPSAE